MEDIVSEVMQSTCAKAPKAYARAVERLQNSDAWSSKLREALVPTCHTAADRGQTRHARADSARTKTLERHVVRAVVKPKWEGATIRNARTAVAHGNHESLPRRRNSSCRTSRIARHLPVHWRTGQPQDWRTGPLTSRCAAVAVIGLAF